MSEMREAEFETLRAPPNSEEAEHALLGSLLIDSAALSKLADQISPADFFLHAHREVFAAITKLISAGQPVDVVTVFDQLGDKAEAVGGLPYLNSLASCVPTAANVGRYAEIVRDKAARRGMLAAADQVRELAHGAPEVGGALEQARKVLAEVNGGRVGHGAEWVDELHNWAPTYDLATLEVHPNWAVRDWILAGKVGALVAGGGTGKTTLLLYMFVCIAIGRPFMGCDVTPGSTVLLTNDDPQEDMEGVLALICRAMRLSAEELELARRRVRLKSLQGIGGLKTFTRAEAGTVVDTGFQSLILQAVEGIPDLVGIALDTLRQFSGGASNDEEVIKMTISAATEVALKSGAFVILPHHTGKENYRDGISDQYAGSGSAALGDNCRFVLVLQKAKWGDIEEKMKRTGREVGDPLVLTSTRGSLLARAPQPMYLYRDGYLMGRVAGSLRSLDQQADEKDRAILRAVRQGAQTKNAIYAVVKGKKSATLLRIDELEGRGHLVRSSQSGSPLLMVSGTGARFLEDSE